MNSGQSIFESLGESKIQALVKEFYEQVKQTPDLRKLYPEKDLSAAEERLYLFLIHVFGGPHTYLEKRGHPMLRRRHFQWTIDGEMRNLWLNCMFRAMDSIEMDTNIREAMMSYFIKVANHMINKE
ncbi:Hemoglobin-like protein HbO [Indibacter alkaliphilus LW1]|jgi:hemoglobin|uniref:Hemoglobin-like protein HbO n=1 Tax=Indibacter alkaliphilus (strain CCUG 57479 / KCTC 22604 / LW1) TaxID=1189612 RepID=S2E0V8_INDAL|nr:cyanoglobin [Indibacter alkaliphilus]EOZ95718.1 Hemoglobin-like protein HbO [Indibacter alkaliphilus LW1]